MIQTYGARVAKYMEDFTQNYSNLKDKSIPKMIGRTIQWERKSGTHQSANCRAQIRERLEGEKQNLKET